MLSAAHIGLAPFHRPRVPLGAQPVFVLIAYPRHRPPPGSAALALLRARSILPISPFSFAAFFAVLPPGRAPRDTLHQRPGLVRFVFLRQRQRILLVHRKLPLHRPVVCKPLHQLILALELHHAHARQRLIRLPLGKESQLINCSASSFWLSLV